MFETYKKGQGAITRRVAFWSLAALIVWGGQGLYTYVLGFDWAKKLLLSSGSWNEGFELPVLGQRLDVAFLIGWGFVVVALFALFRFLNRPKSADFLIETDTELSKVSWPTWKDAWNSTLVVMIFVLFFTAFLFFSDFLLNKLVGLLLSIGGGDS